MAQQKGRTSKADATRRQLLDAAIEVISERGYADTTVERIVEVAGVSKGVAYYHFSSKADIATCILVEGIGEIVDDFVAIAGKAPSAVEALTAMMDSFAATIFRNAGFGRILVSELWRRALPLRVGVVHVVANAHGKRALRRRKRLGAAAALLNALFGLADIVQRRREHHAHHGHRLERRIDIAANAALALSALNLPAQHRQQALL